MKEWRKQWHNSGELMKNLKHVMLQLEEGDEITKVPDLFELTPQAKYVAWLYDNLEKGKNKAKLFRVLAEKMEVCID
jgi:acyl-CoA-binding protein